MHARTRIRRFAVVIGLLAIGLPTAACGSGDPSVVVARVGSHVITKATLDRWTAIEGVLAYQLNPTRPVPKGVVPDPPSYTACVAFLRAHPQASASASAHATAAQLRAACKARYEVLQRHML